jgi:hypothetical protein
MHDEEVRGRVEVKEAVEAVLYSMASVVACA